MKNNKKRKGFTIVELVIVIAVIAILAAVLIPTFASVINSANESKDKQLITNLNKALAADVATGKHPTMHSAVCTAIDAGYNIENIDATVYTNKILWDSVNDLFCYLKLDKDQAIETATAENILYINKKAEMQEVALNQYWLIADELPGTEKFSVYAGEHFALSDENKKVTVHTVGFDAGFHDETEIAEIEYKNDDSTGHTNTIRTNGGKLTINAPYDTVSHWDFAAEVTVEDVHTACYHECGTVGRLYYKDDIPHEDNDKTEGGMIVFEPTAVVYCYMNQTGDAKANSNTEGVKMPGAVVYTFVFVTNTDGEADLDGYNDKKNIDSIVDSIKDELEGTKVGDDGSIYIDYGNGNKRVIMAGKEDGRGYGNVLINKCSHHNFEYDVIEIGDCVYYVCHSCGAYTLYGKGKAGSGEGGEGGNISDKFTILGQSKELEDTDNGFTFIHVTGVTLTDKLNEMFLDEDMNKLILSIGGTDTLIATVTPNDAVVKTVTWTSSDEKVATVDENGVVTAHKTGSATITVKTLDGGYTATCYVTVGECTHPDWDQGTITKQPTCTEEGVLTKKCLICGKRKNESIPKAAHHFVTVSDDGTDKKNYEACTVCGTKNDGFVAELNGTKCYTLRAAIDAITTNDPTTVKMIANEEVDIIGNAIEIRSGKNITIDLNGYTLFGTAGEETTSALITNNGTLTIKDSTDIYKDGTGTGLMTFYASRTDLKEVPSYASNIITNFGNLTVESGKLYNSSSKGGASFTIDTHQGSELYFKGGMADANASSAVRLYRSVNNSALIKAEFTGGVIHSAGGGDIWVQTDASGPIQILLDGVTCKACGYPYSFYESSVNTPSFEGIEWNVKSGVFEGNVYVDSKITISGGSFSKGYVYLTDDNASITGGMFDVGENYVYLKKSTATMTGGTVKGDPDKYFSYGIPDGYYYIENSDGSYNVVKAIASVWIPYISSGYKYYDKKGFGSISEAVEYINSEISWAYAYDYRYLYLYSDCSENIVFTNRNQLYTNGYSYTGTVSVGAEGYALLSFPDKEIPYYSVLQIFELDYTYNERVTWDPYSKGNMLLNAMNDYYNKYDCTDLKIYLYGDYDKDLVVDFNVSFSIPESPYGTYKGTVRAAEGYTLVENEGVYTITKSAD